MIIAIIIGFVTGWLMSMPIGPVNAAAVTRTLKHGLRYGLAVAVGAALMDIIYCGGAAQINQFLVESPIINLIFLGAGCAALLYMGQKQLRSVREDQTPQAPTSEDEARQDALAANAMKRMHVSGKGLFGPFIIGILLYATNVAAVPEWIIVAGIWRSWGALGSGVDINVMFAVGAGLGTFMWYLVLIRWIARRQRGFQPSTLRKINIGTGVAMLIFGAYFAFQIVFETRWHDVRTHFVSNTHALIDSGHK